VWSPCEVTWAGRGVIFVRDARLLVRRWCEFIALRDAELDRGASRAIFLHERDKYQTVDGFFRVMRGLESRWREFTKREMRPVYCKGQWHR
jgi:hypothetical protein